MTNTPNTDSYWLGSLAMTIALASKRDRPQNLLKSTIKEFLSERPEGDELGDLVRQALAVKA
jgi:hypothetical protein